jgi:hypothetical protein
MGCDPPETSTDWRRKDMQHGAGSRLPEQGRTAALPHAPMVDYAWRLATAQHRRRKPSHPKR